MTVQRGGFFIFRKHLRGASDFSLVFIEHAIMFGKLPFAQVVKIQTKAAVVYMNEAPFNKLKCPPHNN